MKSHIGMKWPFSKKVSVKNSAWFLLEKGVTNMERVEARIKPCITGLEL